MEEKTVYIAVDPDMDEPLFATDDAEAVAEWENNRPGRYHHELGVMDSEGVREMIEEFDN